MQPSGRAKYQPEDSRSKFNHSQWNTASRSLTCQACFKCFFRWSNGKCWMERLLIPLSEHSIELSCRDPFSMETVYTSRLHRSFIPFMVTFFQYSKKYRFATLSPLELPRKIECLWQSHHVHVRKISVHCVIVCGCVRFLMRIAPYLVSNSSTPQNSKSSSFTFVMCVRYTCTNIAPK